jgi:glycosyltransferase involved in cell wall biosynthesis
MFISNSETIRQSNALALRVNLKKIKVIYRGRTSDIFQNIPKESISELRNQLHIKPETKVLLNVSRLLNRKGQMDLLQSFAEINKQDSNAILLIAGDGFYRKPLENAIEQLGLQKKVQLLGNRNDIPVILALADVFVFPSHYEGLPGALIEAMFAQKVIVCSDIGENKECVSPNEAVFFKTGKVVDLTEKLNLVLPHLEEYQNMAAAARNAASEKFELRNVVKQYNETYVNSLAI